MVTTAQQLSPTTALLMLMKKRISSPSITSYLPLFVTSRNNVLTIAGDKNDQIAKKVNNQFSLHNL